MTGHVRRRSPGSFELRWQQNGRTRTTTIRTTSKRVAEARLRELMVAADRGEAIEPSKLTVAQLVEQRLSAWSVSGRISRVAVERYGTSAKLLAPIGDIPVQKLGTADVERWHLGMGHLSSSSKRGVHGVLARALRRCGEAPDLHAEPGKGSGPAAGRQTGPGRHARRRSDRGAAEPAGR